MNPIKVNPTNYSSIVTHKLGNILFELEDDHFCYFHSISSYLDEHVVSDPTTLRKSRASYNVKIELRRDGTELIFVSVEYRIPFYYEDDSALVYNEGELTFKALTRESSDVMYSFTSGQYFDGSLKKVSITIGTEWMINGCQDNTSGLCDIFVEEFIPSTDEMYLSIKTLEP